MSIISTSMILCTETSRWVAARRPDNCTLPRTHLCSWPWQHTDGSQFLQLSPSSIFFFCFYSFFLCFPPASLFPSAAFTLPLFWASSSTSRALSLRVHVCSCGAREMVSHRHVAGAALLPMARKRQGPVQHTNTHHWHFVLRRGSSIMREEVTAQMNLGSCQDNLCDITPAVEQRMGGAHFLIGWWNLCDRQFSTQP